MRAERSMVRGSFLMTKNVVKKFPLITHSLVALLKHLRIGG